MNTFIDSLVLGHNALTATPLSSSSLAMPRTQSDMPYFAIVYANKRETKQLKHPNSVTTINTCK